MARFIRRVLAVLAALEPEPECECYVDWNAVRWQEFCDAWVAIGNVAARMQGR